MKTFSLCLPSFLLLLCVATFAQDEETRRAFVADMNGRNSLPGLIVESAGMTVIFRIDASAGNQRVCSDLSNTPRFLENLQNAGFAQFVCFDKTVNGLAVKLGAQTLTTGSAAALSVPTGGSPPAHGSSSASPNNVPAGEFDSDNAPVRAASQDVSSSEKKKKKKKWDIPCQNVYVTGTQLNAIAWSRNNLRKHTCMTPVDDINEATAVLDLEYSPDDYGGATAPRRNTTLDNYFVYCRSTGSGTYCADSTGYALSTNCHFAANNTVSCSSYYGPDIRAIGMSLAVSTAVALADAGMSALYTALTKNNGWAYMYDAKDHHLLWKYEGLGGWDWDLQKYSQCPKKRWGKPCKYQPEKEK